MNNIDPGPVPEPLTGLSFIEQLLISRVKVCLTVFKLRGGQYGYNRQVINFNQDVTELATVLPHSLNSLSNVLIVKRQRDTLTTFSEFRVRKMKVWNAIRCLMAIHSGYRNIVTVDENVLSSLTDDDSVVNQLTQFTISSEEERAVDQQLEQDGEMTQLNELLDVIEHSAAPNLPIRNIRQNVNRQLNISQTSPNDEIPVVSFPVVDSEIFFLGSAVLNLPSTMFCLKNLV